MGPLFRDKWRMTVAQVIGTLLASYFALPGRKAHPTRNMAAEAKSAHSDAKYGSRRHRDGHA